MYKVMTFYTLREGIDPKEFFKFHTKIHSADVKKGMSPARLKKMKRYIVNRVVNTEEIVEGEKPNFIGIIEMWWESKEAHDDWGTGDYKTASGRSIRDDFKAHGGISLFRVALEEEEIPL